MPERPPVVTPKRVVGQATQGSIGRTARLMVRTRWSDKDKLYRVCLEVPAENVRVMLTHRQAFDHAQIVIKAAHRAQFDAMMLRHFAGNFQVPVATVSNVIREARTKREPLSMVDTDPLRFDAGVDGKTGRGYVAVSVGVDRLTRWSVTEADAYARTVIGMTERADNETDVFQTLTAWGAEDQRIRNALNEMYAPREF
jgi:hypothetical protein